MFKQIIHTLIRANKKEIARIMSDIRFFYKNLKENDTNIMIDDCFDKAVKNKYWNYLNYERGLTNPEKDYLQQGIMSILLFACFHYLDNKELAIASDSVDIHNSLLRFRCTNRISCDLHYKLMDAIIMVEKRKNGVLDQGEKNKLYKSIAWTLQNIILKNTNIDNN